MDFFLWGTSSIVLAILSQLNVAERNDNTMEDSIDIDNVLGRRNYFLFNFINQSFIEAIGKPFYTPYTQTVTFNFKLTFFSDILRVNNTIDRCHVGTVHSECDLFYKILIHRHILGA